MGLFAFLDLFDYFLFHVGEIFNYNLYKTFLIPFLFLFFFWDPYNLNVGAFDMVPEISETILSSFHSFTLSCSSEVISTILSSRSLIHSSVSNILLLIPSYSILKSRDITLPTKVCLIKVMVFPVVMYGCESWTTKKAEHRRIDVFELWCREDS